MTKYYKSRIWHEKWFPLVLIIILTIAIFIISIISLISGWQTIFQNLFYFPIILSCVYYLRKGFFFSVLLAFGYFILMVLFSKDPVVLEGAFIRVLIFILVAGVITYLSIIRIRAEDALKRSEEFNRGLVENMPNLVMVFDQDQQVQYVNPAATAALGYSSEEMVGTDIMRYVIPDHDVRSEAVNKECFLSGSGESTEIILLTKKMENLTVILKCALLQFQNQQAILMLLADISDRKRAELALLQANKKLNLLSSITRHDIMNKVVTIQGFMRFARKAKDIKDIEPFLDKISDSAKAIERQIAFSKDYQNLGLTSPKWLNISNIVILASNPAIHITDETGNLLIFADPLFEKVLYNLVDNTIRHGVTATDVNISVIAEQDNIRIVWTDNGVGVPADTKKMIFEKGFGKNTGLGLFLIKEILAITGMTIQETGVPGKGARFEITVPKGHYRIVNDNGE